MPMIYMLKKAAPGALAVFTAVLLFGCSKAEEDPSKAAPLKTTPQVVEKAGSETPVVKIKGDASAGRKIYFKHCHYCHGEKGLGDGPVGIALTPHPADFVHDKKRMRKTDVELYKSITEGIKKEIGGEAMTMPRWKEILSEKERWDVLAFVRELERLGKEAESAGR